MRGNGLIYSVVKGDSAVTRRVINEINLKLINTMNIHGETSSEYLAEDAFAEELINTVRSLDISYGRSCINHLDIVESLYKVIKGEVLSPLTLKDHEFYSDDDYNTRHTYIFRIPHTVNPVTYTYYNTRAYIGIVKAAYDYFDMSEYEAGKDWIKTGKVYISKGGVVTGEYINNCIINMDVFKTGTVDYSSVIKLPVSVITHKGSEGNVDIYSVDSRDPALKLLKSRYIVTTHIDQNIKGKYDIRKYKKLNK